jgi:hypothetical protein
MTNITMMKVADELQRRGINATYEYPGFIATMSNADNPSPIHWGDTNETFMGDVMSPDMTCVIETIDSTITADCDDVSRIADHIACHSGKAKP